MGAPARVLTPAALCRVIGSGSGYDVGAWCQLSGLLVRRRDSQLESCGAGITVVKSLYHHSAGDSESAAKIISPRASSMPRLPVPDIDMLRPRPRQYVGMDRATVTTTVSGRIR